jgi:ABC-type transport system substrate-binding protein
MYGKKGDFKHSYYFEGKIKSIETPDRYTIIFKTVEPYAPFLKYLSSPWCAIVAKEVVDQYKDLKNVAIGTGPFSRNLLKAPTSPWSKTRIIGKKAYPIWMV